VRLRLADGRFRLPAGVKRRRPSYLFSRPRCAPSLLFLCDVHTALDAEPEAISPSRVDYEQLTSVWWDWLPQCCRSSRNGVMWPVAVLASLYLVLALAGMSIVIDAADRYAPRSGGVFPTLRCTCVTGLMPCMAAP
jgi:hypothetical protein